jgi:hypothetical protein
VSHRLKFQVTHILFLFFHFLCLYCCFVVSRGWRGFELGFILSWVKAFVQLHVRGCIIYTKIKIMKEMYLQSISSFWTYNLTSTCVQYIIFIIS